MRYFLVLVFVMCCYSKVLSQDSLRIFNHSIGIEYYGELGFHFGLKLDYGYVLWVNDQLSAPEGRSFYQVLQLRPNINYYLLPKYTNNFLIGSDISFKFLSIHDKKQKYFFIESFLGLKYMRYSYIGRIFERNNNGVFEELNNGGGNALIIDTGILFGIPLSSKKLELVFGMEYFAEFPEDRLIIHHPVARLGFRKLL